MHQPAKNTAYGRDGATHDLCGRILGLIGQDLVERRSSKLFVEARDEPSSSCEKEIGGLSTEERRNLRPVSREQIVELLLDRHLAEQGRVDLLERRGLYIRAIRDLTPRDLPALIEADRLRAEEEYQRGRAEVVRGALVDLERFFVSGLAEATREAGR